MKTTPRTALLPLLSVSTLLAVGCAGPRHEPQSAVYCPSCEMIWVEMPDFNDPYGLARVPAEVMECPDCHNAVVSFFKTGKFEHTCDACGAELVHCTTR